MELVTQANRVTCLPCSLAMVTGISLTNILEIIGHDGTEILWPEKTEPLNFRGFNETEIVEAALELGYALVPIDFNPMIQSIKNARPVSMYTPEQVEIRLDRYLLDNIGIISGYSGYGKMHAVAWDGRQVYDPEGRTYRFEESGIEKIEIVRFYMAIKFKNVPLPAVNDLSTKV